MNTPDITREMAAARRTLRELVNGANTGCLSPERFKYLTGKLTDNLGDIEQAVDPVTADFRARYPRLVQVIHESERT